jgi:hypothetical protein
MLQQTLVLSLCIISIVSTIPNPLVATVYSPEIQLRSLKTNDYFNNYFYTSKYLYASFYNRIDRYNLTGGLPVGNPTVITSCKKMNSRLVLWFFD